MALQIDFNREKFKHLILLVAQESEDDPHFGATKLNKILYFSDFKAFGILGAPITGASYQRLERGPAPREMLPALRQMEAEGDIERAERRYFNLLQKRIKSLTSPDLSLFSPEELEIVKNVIAELTHMTASQVSALSHLEIGWQATPPNEPISYAMVYLSKSRPSTREVEEHRRIRFGDEALGRVSG